MPVLIGLLPGLPLLAAIAVQLVGARNSRMAARVSILIGGLTLLLAAYLLSLALIGGQFAPVSLARDWGILQADPLGLVMATLIAGISLIVRLYSRRYMADEPGYARFYGLLDLMVGALLLMVLAGDLLTLLIAWHLIGVLLYLLLGHDNRSHSAQRYAQWTLLTYRIGDLPLLFAAGLLYHAYGTWSLPELFEQIRQAPDTHQFMGMGLTEVVAALVALSAFARSAQILLHTWLPYTMAGPTPVSALMHAGIVNAGGFLINRFAPVFMHTGDVLHWVFIVGLITAVIGSVLMLTQNDIKKALGYSTMGQMGFMIMECGVGAFSLAIYHLIAHGLFKGTLFLNAGGVIGAARRHDGVPKEEIYTFVVERQAPRQRQPWLLMAVITLIVPATILVLAHWLVAQDFFKQQGAIVLLFFGWITGAQLIFATYRMRSENPWRLFGMMLFSFTVVILGYVLISHAFDLFLYPDEAMRLQMYQAAGIDIVWFDVLVGVVSLVIVFGWLIAYRAERQANRDQAPSKLWVSFYALVAREFHFIGLYRWLGRSLLAGANRLNVWLRWA